MVVAQFIRQVYRPYGFFAKSIIVGLLGLCFVLVCSTFLFSSSSVAFQRNSFSDIKENFSVDEKVKDSRVQLKKIEPGRKEVPKDDHLVESILGGKDEKQRGGRDSNGNNHSAGNDKKDAGNQRADLVRPNATHGSEGWRNEELQKVEDQGQIKQEEEVDAKGDNDVVIEEDGVLNNSTDQVTEEKIENKLGETNSTAKEVAPIFDSRSQFTWKLCNVRSKYNYIPCIDIEHPTGKLHGYRHQERSCPRTPPTCLVPLPPGGYQPPVQWPESKSKILYGNVAHPKFSAFVKTRRWINESEHYLTFPQDQSEFKGGVVNYIDSIDEMVPDIEWGKNIRVVLDIGCTDSSFVAALLEKEVLTLSLGLKDDLVDLAQVALERGFPALVSPFGTRRLPFPSGVFDAIHCGGCGIPWHSNGGKLLLEMNRILRPGGYFMLSTRYDNIKEEEAMSSWTASICWNILAHKMDEISELGVKIYQKPESNDIYQLRRKKSPPICQENENADAAWYVPMKTCLHTIPAAIEQRGTEWPDEWPKRLETFPDWLSDKEKVIAETDFWKAIVNKSYLNGMGINWSSIRNVMDMKSIYGGFAAALSPQKVWVMNVVPVNAPDTLAIIYERGLLGIYHDWCESFGTYPRSYDLLHADHLFSWLINRCKHPVGIAVEMDRILRPNGWAIIRDKVEILDPLVVILKSLHWEIRMTYSQDKEGIICAKKTIWRP
ncbi:probable methyltransferase PMT28 isoform X1 [Telopea speciosissima]|uniref:probable methyltransferase PMT28 isoform X1 n=1 Tax=Telopea speciosissima TaxID=54955 RepID=UPI001CC36DA7|nr:probable methyltransferase PMT28 isoform X1 [Telopea speciosissima]